MDKGTASNVISTCILTLGLLLDHGPAQAWILSIGLFAFSGGITNWLAVKMLFDRIPGLIGSGVIPARFREIRRKVKDLILEHFFDEEYLRRFFAEHRKDVDWGRYIKSSGSGKSPVTSFVENQWEKLTAPEVIQPIIDEQIDRLSESSIGGFLLIVGIDTIRPAVNRFVAGFVASLQDKVLAVAEKVSTPEVRIEIDEKRVVDDIRAQVEPLLEKKLEELHAEDVKRMMEDVIRSHLGWLIVWGNVFGGALGVLTQAFAVLRT